MNTLDDKYLVLLDHILTKGRVKKDRTGVGTISTFGYDMRIDLSEGLSLLTTKYVHYSSVIYELLWFLQGGTDIKYLVENGVKIWNEWPFKNYENTPIERLTNEECVSDASRVRRHFSMEEYIRAIKSVPGFAEKHGRVGKVYGAQWVNWTDVRVNMHGTNRDGFYPVVEVAGYNQIDKLIGSLRDNPDSRRMIVTAWNPPEMDECVLPCCHYAFQCYAEELTVEERIRIHAAAEGMTYEEMKLNWDTDEQWTADLNLYKVPKRRLSLKWQIRSVDTFLGMPFDIASYSILTHMLCAQLNYVPGEMIMSTGDTHIYLNHMDQVKLQMSRKPYSQLPSCKINPEITDIYDYSFKDIGIHGYTYHPHISAPIAV